MTIKGAALQKEKRNIKGLKGFMKNNQSREKHAEHLNMLL